MWSIDDFIKAEPLILDREAGRTIDLRDGQSQKAFASIVLSCDPGSNVNDVRFSIERMGPAEITVSDAGRESDFNIAHLENASDPIVWSSEGDSKTTEDSAKQPERQFSPSERTLLGIQIDCSDEQL
jgi:hypothetical protein